MYIVDGYSTPQPYFRKKKTVVTVVDHGFDEGTWMSRTGSSDQWLGSVGYNLNIFQLYV